ncbi:MAG TPA: hypothetical protein VFA66_15430 [Gaiellaceae bacterium]|nr:hypothetical protein [Gaiellaceae bacterium]
MTAPAEEHWFDRLATRRQVLTGALGAIALALPLVRTAAARATHLGCSAETSNNPHACQTGCFYATHKKFLATSDGCDAEYDISYGVALPIMLLINPDLGALSAWLQLAQYTNCLDLAMTRQKAEAFDCMQPGCPGFDPCGKYGPCAVCLEGAKCCPAPDDNQLGYVCCACCNPDTGEGCGAPCPGP